jgi:thioesterase domain-containing protein
MYLLEHQSQDGCVAEFTTVTSIASQYLSEIRTVQPTGPYFLGGYSFGGVVALEIAQQVAARNEDTGLLVLLDPPSLVARGQQTPRAGERDSWVAPSAAVSTVVRHVGALARLRPRDYSSYIGPRAAEILLIPVIRELCARLTYRACLGTGRRLPTFTRRTYIRDVYQHARLEYTARPCRAPAVLFKGSSRCYAGGSDWEQLLGPTLAVHIVAADHLQMKEEASVPLWGEALRKALLSAQDNAMSRGLTRKVG